MNGKRREIEINVTIQPFEKPSQKSFPPSLFQREESFFSCRGSKNYGFPPLKKGDKGGFLELPGNLEF
jgi:hypothetical protein